MEIAKMIDHTLLKPEATENDIMKLCREAKENNFASVCVNPCYVKLSKDILKDSSVKVCTVIGFPLGANTVSTKVFEAKNAAEDGAEEVDMVLNISKLKSKKYDYIANEIKAVVDAVKQLGNILVKVIIETCYLTDDEKVEACKLAMSSGADFVKTSTGFGTGGATAYDISLMRKTVGNKLGVKAAGGIRTAQKAKEMIEAGANRIGTSSGIQIVKGW